MSQISFLIVEIAGQIVALNVDAVQAVLPMDEIIAVPHTPPAVLGITSKRGHVLTVIDGRVAITSAPAPETDQSVVININGHRYALLVDAIDEVISVESGDIEPPPPGMIGAWNELATGMIRLGDDRKALVIRIEYFVEMTEAQIV